MRLQTLIRRVHARRAQAGATAVEFALVFPVFFLLFYGLLTYGLIFLMRMGLQHAAEEGARAALIFPAQSCQAWNRNVPCSAEQSVEFQIASRMSSAYARAAEQAGWMNGWQPPQVDVRICASGVDCVADEDAPLCVNEACENVNMPTVPACGRGLAGACQVLVTLRYNYREKPVLPRVFGMAAMTPDHLVGQARLLLDGKAMLL